MVILVGTKWLVLGRLKHHYYFTITISAHCGWIRFNEIMKTNNNSLYLSSLFAVDSDVYNAVSSKEKRKRIKERPLKDEISGI